MAKLLSYHKVNRTKNNKLRDNLRLYCINFIKKQAIKKKYSYQNFNYKDSSSMIKRI